MIRRKISVLWVTRNRCLELIKSIESVHSQTRQPHELVVVDNASEDDTVNQLKSRYPHINLICLEKNMGCPSARNIGVESSSGDIVYMLDDDGWLHPRALEEMVAVFEADVNVGAVMSNLIQLAPNEGSSNLPIIDKPNIEIFTFTGGCTAVDRCAFLQCGGFPDDFFRQAEEASLVLNMMDNGYKIMFCQRSIMFHLPSQIERYPDQFMFYHLRNTIRIAFRQIPFPFFIAKVVLQIFHGLRYSLSQRCFWIIPKLVSQMLLDVHMICSMRNPVKIQTYEKLLKANRSNK